MRLNLISLLRLFFILFCWNNHISAQDSSKFSIILNPIGFNLNQANWEELGLGYYDIKNNFANNVSIVGMYKRYISNKVSLNIGLGIRQSKFNFDYVITHPFDESTIIDRVNRYHKRVNLAPHFGLSFNFKLFDLSVGYEIPFEIITSSNIEYYFGPTEIFIDSETQDVAYFEIVERNAFVKDVFKQACPVLMCDYKFSNLLSFNFTALVKPYGKFYQYQLDIKGENPYTPAGYNQLNDSLLNNHNLTIFFGIQYSIR